MYFSGHEYFYWREFVPGRCTVFEHTFAKPLPIVPTVIYGIRQLDLAATNSPRVAFSLPSVSESGFTLAAKSFLHGTFNLEANVMVLPNGRIPFQHGYLDASDHPGGRSATQNATIPVTFAKRFRTPPKVYGWFTEISQPRGHRSLKTSGYVSDVTPQGMTVHIDTWAGREFEGARVAWLAFPAEFDGKTTRADNSLFSKGEVAQDAPWYGGRFSRDPKVFCGINFLDFPETDKGLRVYARHESATKDRLRWQGGTWDDKVGFCWIAVE